MTRPGTDDAAQPGSGAVTGQGIGVAEKEPEGHGGPGEQGVRDEPGAQAETGGRVTQDKTGASASGAGGPEPGQCGARPHLERRHLLPVAREGLPFILISAVPTVAVIVATDARILEALLVFITAFVVYFFRDPDRDVPADKDAIVSPADGRVIKVERVNDERFTGAVATKISIFMSLFNVHVNRAPSDARVLRVIYNPGRFFSANLDKASLENEQNAIVAEGPDGRTFAFNQIAGLVARRIVCYPEAGSILRKGERFGLIRFGSRLDVYLPAECRVDVRVGEKVKAGSSIVGWW